MIVNVLLYPSEDGYGLAALIHHYNKVGANVFVIEHSSMGINHSTSAYWPAFLCKSTKNSSKTNIEFLPEREDLCSGEDYFLRVEEPPSLYGDDITCQFIDPAQVHHLRFDVFHTLRGKETYLKSVTRLSKIYHPSAKWISSTFTNEKHDMLWLKPRHVAKFIPANYADGFRDRIAINLMFDDFDLKLLGCKPNIDRSGFACFNNAFKFFHKKSHSFFVATNQLLRDDLRVTNYGGNLLCDEADIRYSKTLNSSFDWNTLSPVEQAKKLCTLRGVILLKDFGYGDRQLHQAIASLTPVITTNKYISCTNSHLYLRAGLNCLIADTPEEFAKAIRRLHEDDDMFYRLSAGMEQVKNSIFDESYWTQWRVFLSRVIG